jgi:hypothetical protein
MTGADHQRRYWKHHAAKRALKKVQEEYVFRTE